MSEPPPSSSRRDFLPIAITAAVALAYVAGHLAWYRQTPLGQAPVLDEQENLAFAEAIARGVLPHEPFYRAPGYALMLAALRALGVPVESLFAAALTLGAVLHAVNAALVAQIARTLFQSRGAAFAAGIVYALHPVLVHYSTQALDSVPALTFFLLGLACLPWTSPDRIGRWLATSFAWALATICRPNYLFVWCALPLLAMWLARRRWANFGAALAGGVVFVSIAAWQWRVSGEPGFLPWQGPYNLWAANEPGAHGRYLVQKISLPAKIAQQNPTRAESIFLFRQETGHAPADVRELNAHWRARFLDRVLHHPLAWSGQLLRKAYALANNWEQYNNKTFAFHQARSPWLRWNPLGWGLVFVCAIAGTLRLAAENARAAALFGLVALACAISVVLFFVSARFRLPLAALGIILSGGALAAPGFWRAWPRRRQIVLALALALGAALTFSTFDRVNDRITFVQDHALLARAASTVGDDTTAWNEARAALALQAKHPDALRVAVAAYFNQLVTNRPALAPETEWLDVCTRLLAEPRNDVQDLRAVAALALWRAGQRDAAVAEWRALGGTPSAVAARLLLREIVPDQVDFASWPPAAWDEPLVRVAALLLRVTAPQGVELGDPREAATVANRLFAPTAKPPTP